jgi:hypothetical protein
MEITITKQHTQTVKIPVPCFWKSHYRWIGVIDDKTLITFVDYGDRCEISSFELPTPGNVWLEATQDGDHFNLTTEEEFFEAYDKAVKSITITPILKTW